MFSDYVDFLARKERCKDLLREAEREQLVATTGFRRLGNRPPHRKVAGWIGTQMIEFGSKLQHYSDISEIQHEPFD